MGIKYVVGDATNPQTDKPGIKLICHVCNNIGVWGAGFVVAISNKWPVVRERYVHWYETKNHSSFHPFGVKKLFELGEVQFVLVDLAERIVVANMIAQNGVRGPNNARPLRYHALAQCLQEVNEYVNRMGAVTIHMPRIGCGLAGGSWPEVETIIQACLGDNHVTVYDFAAYDVKNLSNFWS